MSADPNELFYDLDDEDYDQTKYENSYGAFIERLRARLTHSSSHTIGVLTPQLSPTESSRESLLYLHLSSGVNRITLVLQQSNLYVRGYSNDGGDTWWELSDSNMIPGTRRSLEFAGTYTELERRSGLRRADLFPNYSLFNDAISNLATERSPAYHQSSVAKSLLALTQMISEAARIRLISNHISTYWWFEQRIPEHSIGVENAWRFYSSAVQRSDNTITMDDMLPDVPTENPYSIGTLRQAIAAFALLVYYDQKTVTEQLYVDAAVRTPMHARTLVSINYIRVNDIDGESPGDLYGTVFVTDCWGQHTVYDRSRDDAENKGPTQYATITGPTTAISGEDAFFISVSLKDRDAYISPDDYIAQDIIRWDPRDKDSLYNTNIEALVTGDDGNVTVGYSVLTYALSATINVVMINGDDEDPADVYGMIKATISLGESLTTKLSLFEKSSDERVKVRPWESIPLDRWVIPVRMISDLIIEASLWDYDSISADDKIAEGIQNFAPVVGPTQKKNITGDHGKIEVSITFH